MVPKGTVTWLFSATALPRLKSGKRLHRHAPEIRPQAVEKTLTDRPLAQSDNAVPAESPSCPSGIAIGVPETLVYRPIRTDNFPDEDPIAPAARAPWDVRSAEELGSCADRPEGKTN